MYIYLSAYPLDRMIWSTHLSSPAKKIKLIFFHQKDHMSIKTRVYLKSPKKKSLLKDVLS